MTAGGKKPDPGRIRDVLRMASARRGCRGARPHRTAVLPGRLALTRGVPRAVHRSAEALPGRRAPLLARRDCRDRCRDDRRARQVAPDRSGGYRSGLAAGRRRLRARRTTLYRDLDLSEGVLTGCSLGSRRPARSCCGMDLVRAAARSRSSPTTTSASSKPIGWSRRSPRPSGPRGSQTCARHHNLRPFRHRRHRDDAHSRRARTANAGRHRRRTPIHSYSTIRGRTGPLAVPRDLCQRQVRGRRLSGDLTGGSGDEEFPWFQKNKTSWFLSLLFQLFGASSVQSQCLLRGPGRRSASTARTRSSRLRASVQAAGSDASLRSASSSCGRSRYRTPCRPPAGSRR